MSGWFYYEDPRVSPGEPLDRAKRLLRDAGGLTDEATIERLAPRFSERFLVPESGPWSLSVRVIWDWLAEQSAVSPAPGASRQVPPRYTERQLRLIDRLIAKHVDDLPDKLISIDGPIEYTFPGADHPTPVSEIQHYTRDDGAAFYVRLLMEKRGWLSSDQLTWMGWGGRDGSHHPYGYSIWFERWDRDDKPHDRITRFEIVRDGGRDAALAVSLAALKALGVDVRAELAKEA